jgi:DNA-binding NarL/FixJ family response regulator
VSAADAPVLVIEDDTGMRTLISALLERRGYRVLEAAAGEEGLALVRQQPPSLVLLDIELPGLSGYEVCRELRAEFGDRVAIVFISGVRTEPYDRVAGLRLGADDYIVKPFAPDELLARVDRLIEQAPAAAEQRPPNGITSRLSNRELEVLRLVAEGLMSKEIARELSVSTKTVENHIQSILVKLDVHTRAQAVAVALRHGVTEIPGGHRRRPQDV